MAEIVTFIQHNLNRYAVSQLCSTLKFLESTCYKALASVPSNRDRECRDFGRRAKETYGNAKQRYDAVKICRVLNDAGTP